MLRPTVSIACGSGFCSPAASASQQSVQSSNPLSWVAIQLHENLAKILLPHRMRRTSYFEGYKNPFPDTSVFKQMKQLHLNISNSSIFFGL